MRLARACLSVVVRRLARVVVMESPKVRRASSPSRAPAVSHADVDCERDADGSLGFRLAVDGAVCCRCHVWTARPHPDEDLVALDDDGFMVGALLTEPAHRGRGYAATLIANVSDAMAAQGLTRGVAIVWHNNYPSIAAFARAGWSPRSRLVLVHPRGFVRPLIFARHVGQGVER